MLVTQSNKSICATMLEAPDPPGPWKFYNNNSSELFFILNLPRAGLWGGPGARWQQWVDLSSPTGTVLPPASVLNETAATRAGFRLLPTSAAFQSTERRFRLLGLIARSLSAEWWRKKQEQPWLMGGLVLIPWLSFSMWLWLHQQLLPGASRRWSGTPEVKGLDGVLFK